MPVDDSRSHRPAKYSLRLSGRRRRLTASTLACALMMTLAPVAGSWGLDPGSVTRDSADEAGAETRSLPDVTWEPEAVVSAEEPPPAQDQDVEPGQHGAPGEDSPSGDLVPESDPATDTTKPGEYASEERAGDPGDPITELALNVRIKSDGTPSWDGDSEAGNDSGPNNGIVRVNDTVTYEVEHAVPVGSAENVSFALTFPRGMEITDMPGYCQSSGSSITPVNAGEPEIPITAESVTELAEQTLVCNRGSIASGVDIVDVTVKVLNLAHQGQELRVQAAELSADGADAVTLEESELPAVQASARLKWDISKNGTSLAEDSGYVYGPHNAQCPWDTTRTCKTTTFPVLLSAPSNGKGAMPAVGDVTFTEDLRPETLYPSLTPAQLAEMNADLDKYGSRMVTSQLGYAQPGSVIGGEQDGVERTATNSVRDSGTQQLEQSGPGTIASVTVSEADYSLRSFPEEALTPVGTALPGNVATAVAQAVRVFTPVETIRDFGIKSEDGNSWTLPTYNATTNFIARGFDPATDVQSSADQPGALAQQLPEGVTGPVHWNDYRLTTPKVELGGTFRKYFLGVPGAAGNMNPRDFNPGHAIYGEGPPGGATLGSGGITVAPTQTLTSLMFFRGTKSDAPAAVSAVGCDAWDPSELNLQALETSPLSGPGNWGLMQRVPSNGAAAWASGYNNVPGKYFATEPDELPDMKFQYSAVPGVPNSGTECGEAQGPWYDSPTDPAFNNDPVLAEQGTYSGVARVRAFATIPEPISNDEILFDGVYLAASIGLRVVDSGQPTGTKIPNYGGVKMVFGEELTPAQILAHPTEWSKNSYLPESHVGGGGDRVILSQAQARIEKLVRKGETGAFSSVPPQTSGDDLVQYQLRPSLTSGASTSGVKRDLWVEECVPGSQTYRSASLPPALVLPHISEAEMPGDAKRPSCADGETYVRWEFPAHEVNTPVVPIVMSVGVNPNADNGIYVNTAVVWAEDDASSLRQRTDEATIQISNIRGFRITKVPLTPVVQVNGESQPFNELNEWSVRLSNRLPDNAETPTDPDVIDVLPRNGALGSEFSGSFTFHSLDVTQGDLPESPVRVAYTSAEDPSENPTDASNRATGETVWCDAPAGGEVVSGSGSAAECPADPQDVTAVRVQRAGAFGTDSSLEFTLRMLATGNRDGDVYVNRASGHAAGFISVVQSVEAPEVAVASTLGDFAWWDFTRDGINNEWKGNPEQPASGVTVRLSGADDLGNPVDRSARTGADGAYLFEHLRSAGPEGYLVQFERPDGSQFTVQGAGSDPERDSNADPETGAAEPVFLGRGVTDLTVDVGLLPEGTVQVNKLLDGAGAGAFAATDTLQFHAVCTFDPEVEGSAPVEVLNELISLEVNGADAVTSEVLGPLPAFTTCTFTETDAGNADAPAEPVVVTIPWDAETETAGATVASMTNFYSAGSVEVTKVVEGDEAAVAKAAGSVFEVLVSCQRPELTAEGEEVRSDVYSGVVKLKAGQTKYLVDDADEARMLPLGTTCFGEEIRTGGASQATVEQDSFENGVTVTSGSPEELQTLTITAVNTFTDETPGGPGGSGGPGGGSGPAGPLDSLLARTGSAPLGAVILLALGLLVLGAGTAILRWQRRARFSGGAASGTGDLS